MPFIVLSSRGNGQHVQRPLSSPSEKKCFREPHKPCAPSLQATTTPQVPPLFCYVPLNLQIRMTSLTALLVTSNNSNGHRPLEEKKRSILYCFACSRMLSILSQEAFVKYLDSSGVLLHKGIGAWASTKVTTYVNQS